jgi:hypothetical protein
MTAQDRRIVIHLLDLLLEHEESLIDSHSYNGDPGRGIISYRVVTRSRRTWRRANAMILKLQAEDAILSPSEGPQ